MACSNKERTKAASEALIKKWEIANQYQVDKSCPFCKKSMAVVEQDKINNDLYLVKCRECYAITERAPTPEDAIELWNDEVFPDYIWLTNKDVPYSNDPEVWGELKNAVVLASFAKYKKEKKMALKSWRNSSAYEDHIHKAKLEQMFFLSEGFHMFSEIDGEKIVETADKQAKYDVDFREPNNCRGCGNTDCEHQKYIWWLWNRGNNYDKCLGFKKGQGKRYVKLWTGGHLYPLEPR